MQELLLLFNVFAAEGTGNASNLPQVPRPDCCHFSPRPPNIVPISSGKFNLKGSNEVAGHVRTRAQFFKRHFSRINGTFSDIASNKPPFVLENQTTNLALHGKEQIHSGFTRPVNWRSFHQPEQSFYTVLADKALCFAVILLHGSRCLQSFPSIPSIPLGLLLESQHSGSLCVDISDSGLLVQSCWTKLWWYGGHKKDGLLYHKGPRVPHRSVGFSDFSRQMKTAEISLLQTCRKRCGTTKVLVDRVGVRTEEEERKVQRKRGKHMQVWFGFTSFAQLEEPSKQDPLLRYRC